MLEGEKVPEASNLGATLPNDLAVKKTCRIIHAGDTGMHSKQGLWQEGGISTETCNAEKLSMHLVTFGPGESAMPHLHEGHETAIYLIEGEVGMLYGSDLQDYLVVRAGDFLYIPAGMPHQPINISCTKRAVAVVARTDPNEQESVVVLS
jgi:uncharacterized RmlC-like cupin family protein